MMEFNVTAARYFNVRNCVKKSRDLSRNVSLYEI